MSEFLAVRTQVELDAALGSNRNAHLRIEGTAELLIQTTGHDEPWIDVRAGAELSIVSRDSSSPRIKSRDSSSPRIKSRDSSSPRIVSRDSSSPRVTASGYVQLGLFGHVIARCSAHVAVQIEGPAEVEGGQQTRVVRPTTTQEWCDWYGVRVTDGCATVFKAVDDTYCSPKGGDYTPGTTPAAQDWDGGKIECGGGLHFSPTPTAAREFNLDATRYVACTVRLADMRPPEPSDNYPQKIKASRCSGPCRRVDEDGERELVGA